MSTSKTAVVVASFILGLGIFGAGYSIGKGIYLIKKMNRTVSVKGLAEKEVKSNLAVWEINYREVGNDLVQLDGRLQHDQQLVMEFLKTQGFSEQELERTQLKVEDRLANVYNQPTTENASSQRYVVTGGTRVRSDKVDLVEQTVQVIDKLLQQGVSLAFDVSSFSPNPSYYFTQLDSIRPGMLAEATKSARMVADQFAKDSGSRLGGIQHASQGVYQIMGRDTNATNAEGAIAKTVRVVTTIDYQLR